jgi:3-hydroxyacyl-CoA dehydrogenase/enoyl-CoA hydratase/3-hydroxybutyryl-CoA epimerase/enoyl-CoA isomerase
MIYNGKIFTIEQPKDGVARLHFDLAGASANTFGAAALLELREAISAVSGAPDVRALVLTSGKEGFVAGADVREFLQWFRQPPAELEEMLAQAQATFGAIENLPFPTVAAINGYALGGGLEYALAADFRVAATTARLGLPEVRLGLLPGWGGTVRLTRLIGADNALEWICTGEERAATEALRLGAVDAVVEPAALFDAAARMARLAAEGAVDYAGRRRQKQEPVALHAVEKSMVFATVKARLAAKAGLHYPAPSAAAACVERNSVLPAPDALRVEAQTFTELAQTPAAGNLVRLFLNEQSLKRAAKKLTEAARPVSRLAVAGAGVMGAGIAYQSALKGTPVLLKDVSEAALQGGMTQLRDQLTGRVMSGRMRPEDMVDALMRCSPVATVGELARADLVVEAVVENESVKRAVLSEIENVVADTAIIATNTSTLSVSGMAESLKRPERFCGMHFFNPVPVMPLVEVIRGRRTDEATIATVAAFARTLGKNPVVVNDCPGFLVNRILFPYLNAFEALVHDGADFRQIDAVMERFGWTLGPAALLDVVGLDVASHAADVLASGYPERMARPDRSVLAILFKAGRLGRKSGGGFYRYETRQEGKPVKAFDATVIELLRSDHPVHYEFSEVEIVERLMIPMCLEAVRCLEDGVVAAPQEVDMALVWGIGFPSFRGGALRYIEETGVEKFLQRADYHAGLGAMYRAPESLRALAGSGGGFFRGS